MLKDKVAIITGGTRGIGFEIAKLFLKNHAKVIIFGSREESVNKALDKLKEEGFNAKGYAPLLSNIEEVKNTFAKIKDEFGHIDILINNAGISSSTKLENYTEDEYNKITDLNIKSVFVCSKEIVPYLKETKGVIINTSSMVSIYGQPSGVMYPTSKFAVNGMTKSLARELAPLGIRVNAVAPGITNTDMVANLPKEMIEPLIRSIPLGRIGEPIDVANAFLFLASDMASYVTGNILSVDGCARA
ncbi:MAG: glucose 1-dehydrogenase [Bacilli bacterium]|jgi:NAD(P)-dependent dehydrogenase (short-subunit alcohol dehydrogenase family)|nr:glucose 1-dehydrogenase [Bacilli bacterium]